MKPDDLEKKFIEINLNSTVRFRLTKEGEEVSEFTISNEVSDGIYEMELWNFIRIFGNYFGNGMPILTNENKIYVRPL